MICDTCNRQKNKYCKIFKVKTIYFDKGKDYCIMYSKMKNKIRKSQVKKNSIKQEKKLAKRLNAKLTPASGALCGAKGDMIKGKYLIESKATKKDRITLKKEWLDEIRGQAIKSGKCPVLVLDFYDQRYFILSEEDFEEITNK